MEQVFFRVFFGVAIFSFFCVSFDGIIRTIAIF
jgi:hypothetical protein